MGRKLDIKINDNDIAKYIVISGSNCSLSEKTAANEFVKYIEKSTGKLLKTSDDNISESRYEIVIGHTNRKNTKIVKELDEEEYCIFCENNKLFILGGDVRGTLYGVYAFFEEYLGWRWYAKDVEDTIFNGEIHITEDIFTCDKPIFEYRDVYYYGAFDPSWSVKMKVNGAVTRKLGKEIGGGVSYAGEHFVHTFNWFMPIKDYFPTHPEYFALQNGVRNDRHLYTQLCLTNPDVLKIMTEQVLKRLDNDPNARLISVSTDDSYLPDSYCHCEECERIHKEEESPMGSLLRFVNSIADTVKEKYPNVAIDTLAYQHTFQPPKITRPRDNVIIRICTWNPELSKKHEEQKGILNGLKIWSDICKRIYIWDYTANFSDYLVSLPNLNNLRPNMALFANNCVKGVFVQGNYQSESGEFGELKSYLLAKLLWNPNMSEDEYQMHIDEFLCGYYGKGWKFIREFIDYTHEIITGSKATARGNPSDILPPEKFNYDLAASMWAEAENLAEDEETLKRILRSKMQLIHWKLFIDKNVGDEKEKKFHKLLREYGISALNEGLNVPDPGVTLD